MEPADASKPLTALNPFIVNKFFQTNVGAVKVTPMRLGNRLIQSDRRTCALTSRHQGNTKHPGEGRPSSVTEFKPGGGVIRCRELVTVAAEDIKSELQKQGVSEVKKIFFTRDNVTQTSNTLILTFDSPTAPKVIGIG